MKSQKKTKEYETPKLIDYGNIAEITKAKGDSSIIDLSEEKYC